VWLEIDRGKVDELDVEVGGPDPRLRSRTRDLGFVEAAELQDVMLSIAESARNEDLDEAVMCAMLSEGFEDWSRVIALARDEDRPEDIRESAIFWLGQQASAVATEGLTQLVADDDVELELREHAIFSLSQQDIDVAFPALKNVALNSRHPQLREEALFWLAQHDDPRVVNLIEEILLQ
jgi:HEAT repeat protein